MRITGGTLLTLVLLSTAAVAQEKGDEKKRTQKDIVKDKRIYFYLREKDKNIRYFLSGTGPDGSEPVANYNVFSLKGGNSVNIYFKWMNPLRYRIAFKDTTYTSPSDVAINDFMKNLSLLDVTKTSVGEKGLGGDNIKNINATNSTGPIKGSDILSTGSVFKTKDLNLLMLQYLRASFPSADSSSIQTFFSKLHDLENAHLRNIPAEVKKNFNTLLEISEYDKVAKVVKEVKEDGPDKYQELFEKVAAAKKYFAPLYFKITDKYLETYTHSVVESFLEEVSKQEESDKILVGKLDVVLDIMKESVAVELDEGKKGYFNIKNISFKDGNDFESAFTVSSYELDKDKNEFKKKESFASAILIFERHEPIKISVSTGILYSSSRLTSFGVAEANGAFTVSENTIDRETAIPGVFLNFHFNLGSRYFLPLLQIGADPTKKFPFLLLGGGVAIPSTKFAITGGPMWTWNQRLDKLVVGGSVASTTDLEKDIKYKFDSKPKGYYIGLQFNF